jgi:NADH-quinone oxidoreductase subunit E
MSFSLTRDHINEANDILKRYPTKRAALLPVLWLVQEQEGYVPDDAVTYVAQLLDLAPAEVWGVVTFYTMFQKKPIGRHHIQVCTNMCCRLRGADVVLSHLKKRLGVGVGESTPDGKFHLSTVECLGSCGTAPMMQIDNDYYENLDAEKIDKIIADFK